MSHTPESPAQPTPHQQPRGPTQHRKPKTACLWVALALLLVLLVPLCSLAAYVNLSGQPVSLGGDALRIAAESVPVRLSSPFLDTSSGSDDRRSCSGGRCTETNCDYNELLIDNLKFTLTYCTTTTP